MYETYVLRMDGQAMHALKQAIQMGALAERQATLRELIAHNRGSQTGDSYESELVQLEVGTASLLNAKPASEL